MQAPSKIDPFKTSTKITFNQNDQATMDFSGKLRCDYYGETVSMNLRKGDSLIPAQEIRYKVSAPPYQHVVILGKDNSGVFQLRVVLGNNSVVELANGECDYDSSQGNAQYDCAGGPHAFPSALFGEAMEFTHENQAGKLLYKDSNGDWQVAGSDYVVDLEPPQTPNCDAVRIE